jgi:hypothetical protein
MSAVYFLIDKNTFDHQQYLGFGKWDFFSK